MDYKHCCVIDAQNRYKTLVLAVNEPDESGDAQEKIQYYTLLGGERLIDAAPPVIRPYAGADGFIKPVWEGSEWKLAQQEAAIKQLQQSNSVLMTQLLKM